jgi:hypothetical protein
MGRNLGEKVVGLIWPVIYGTVIGYILLCLEKTEEAASILMSRAHLASVQLLFCVSGLISTFLRKKE